MPSNFLPSLAKLRDSIKALQKQGIDISKDIDRDKLVYDYKAKQDTYYIERFNSALKAVKDSSLKLNSLIAANPENHKPVTDILQLMPDLDSNGLPSLLKVITAMEKLASQFDIPQKYSFSLRSNIPALIKPDLDADIQELQRCFHNQCYRSAVILCGRIIETALHWKYFDSTGFDLLEKSPGMGLGSLIAKLREKNIELDPAVQQQIHLVNQVRVFSVHKKQEAFLPSEDQTQAIILYTTDILNKLFAK